MLEFIGVFMLNRINRFEKFHNNNYCCACLYYRTNDYSLSAQRIVILSEPLIEVKILSIIRYSFMILTWPEFVECIKHFLTKPKFIQNFFWLPIVAVAKKEM